MILSKLVHSDPGGLEFLFLHNGTHILLTHTPATCCLV
jgi:hypothetical protein